MSNCSIWPIFDQLLHGILFVFYSLRSSSF
uniref:Uncharacterized protein n=1 Tax=Arundo donax TaxID=35708 RepID=A0A0A9H0V0_ARUDO